MGRKQMLAWKILEKAGEEDLKLFCSGSWVKIRTHIIYPSFLPFCLRIIFTQNSWREYFR